MYWKLWKYLLGKNGQVVALKCYTVSQCWLELWCSFLCKHYETVRNGTFSFRSPKTAVTQPLLVRPPSGLSGLFQSWNTYGVLLGQSEKLQRQQSLSCNMAFNLVDPAVARFPASGAENLECLVQWDCFVSEKFLSPPGTHQKIRNILVTWKKVYEYTWDFY